jgi:hypothetical protein
MGLTDDDSRLLAVTSEVQLVGTAKAASLAKAARKDLNAILNSIVLDRSSPEEIISGANANERKLNLFVAAAHDELNK